MWPIFKHRRLDKQLAKTSMEVQKRYEKWKDILEISGPVGLKLVQGFRDEALQGEWKIFRSSRLNQQYQVIYQSEGDRLKVYVIEVTPHDYRKKS